MIEGICTACGRKGHRFGTTHGPNAPERWDPIACINGLLWEVDALRAQLREAMDEHCGCLPDRWCEEDNQPLSKCIAHSDARCGWEWP